MQFRLTTNPPPVGYWLRNKMTASQKAKQLGCKNLKQITDKTGTSLQTLTNWYHNKFELFYAVCIGVAELCKKDD